MIPARLIASTLGVLLVSCSATRYSTSPAVEDLTHYVLVIAGVAFVTVSAGAGLVVLAPAALLAS